MAEGSRFIQISAGSIGLYALDESGVVWQYRTDPPGRKGRWIPVIDEDDAVNRASEKVHHFTAEI